MLQENIDYYLNEDGNFVLKEEYHLKEAIVVKIIANIVHGSFLKMTLRTLNKNIYET